MSILGKGEKIIPGGAFRQQRVEKQHTRAREIRKEEKGLSIFGGKSSLTRGQLRTALGKSSPYIPGSGGRILPREERVGLEKGVFGKKYGSEIGEDDYRKAIKALEKSRSKAPTQTEKAKIERQARFLKGLGGKS